MESIIKKEKLIKRISELEAHYKSFKDIQKKIVILHYLDKYYKVLKGATYDNLSKE